MANFFEDIESGNAVGVTKAITEALRHKMVGFINEARLQVAAEFFGEMEELAEAPSAPRKNPGMHDKLASHGFAYKGKKGDFHTYQNAEGSEIHHKFPTTNGNHSVKHITPGGKIMWKSSGTGDTDIHQHLEKHWPKKKVTTEGLKQDIRHERIQSGMPSVAGEETPDKAKLAFKMNSSRDRGQDKKSPFGKEWQKNKHKVIEAEASKPATKTPEQVKAAKKKAKWNNDERMPWPKDYFKARGSKSSISGFSESEDSANHHSTLKKAGYMVHGDVHFKDIDHKTGKAGAGKGKEYLHKGGHKVSIFPNGSWESGHYKGGSWTSKRGKAGELSDYVASRKGKLD